jgi:hypothetical protein
MAITTASQSQIGQNTAKNSQVVTTAIKLFNSGGGGSSGPTITSIIVTDSGYNNLDESVVEPSNSFIKIIGTGFDNGANVFIDGTQVPAANVTFTSSTELRVALPVLTNNTNNIISIFNTNLAGAISANTLRVEGVLVSYLVVAGGGSGGSAGSTGADNRGGGGGAGGVLSGSIVLSLARGTNTITIGSGGAYGSSGNNTTFGSLFTAIGGGRGGIGGQSGQNGGSGGGGGAIGSAGNFSGGTGIAGQGNNGGTGGTDQSTYRMGGAGGGAGAVGQNARAAAVNGGVGIQSSISGTATYYGGGGAGGGSNGTGGLGGGGNSPSTGGAVGTAGGTNTGGGAGGASAYTNTSGAGGSGILIISYPGTQIMTGGNVTTSNANTIHTFTSSGTLTY